MKLKLALTLLALVFSAPWSAQAQPASKGKGKSKPAAEKAKPAAALPAASAAAPSKEAPGETKSGSAPASGDSQMGSFDFDSMEARKITTDPSGNLTMIGNVSVKSADFNIECDQLRLNQETKVMVAEGSPVKMDQGEDIKAECRHLTHNMEKKSSILEGNPILLRKVADGYMRTIGDKITVTQQENGQAAVDIEMFPNSNKRAAIEKLDSNMKKKSGSAAQRKGPAKKVNNDKEGLDMIKAPEAVSKTPGTD